MSTEREEEPLFPIEGATYLRDLGLQLKFSAPLCVRH